MQSYEYGRIKRLADSLAKSGVPERTVERIMTGGESIANKDKPEKKAKWMKGAMDRMDSLLDAPIRNAVRENCACCLGGKRLMLSKDIAKQHESLEERIKAANETKFVFGHGVTMQEDGRLLVTFAPEGLESYRCVCLPKATEPVSITYCYCCGGHIKHHLQIALGRKLACKVRTSALASGGNQACSFLFTILDEA